MRAAANQAVRVRSQLLATAVKVLARYPGSGCLEAFTEGLASPGPRPDEL